MKNYAAYAEKCLRNQVENLKKQKCIGLDIKKLTDIADGIKRSVHFELPDAGKLLDDDLRGMRGQHLRLPFKEITIEYDFDFKEELLYGEETSTKMLIYASEIDCLQENDANLKSLINENNLQNQQTVILIHACYGDKNKNFVITSIGAILQTDWNNPLNPDKQYKIKNLQSKIGTEVYFVPYVLKILESEYWKSEFPEKYITHLAEGITQPVLSLLELCEALTCKNVGYENIYTENKKLNQRRINDGKIPFYETKTLTLTTINGLNVNEDNKNLELKNSPRQHLRRGHIRHLKTGVNIWINACVVGNKNMGIIEKSYKVEA